MLCATMGVEYLITYPAHPAESLQETLARLASHWDSEARAGYFSTVEMLAENAMPDASLAIEPAGIYFCDHGGQGRAFLGRLVAALVSRYDQVTVQEYE
ncbi:MAG: hypothetical protein ABN482_10755 [Corticimicrobacter sp.]|uniref:hypothetical protein n=1 Tax=Corticimicrobacter sp. TaxID=2678536 RepID=UPI0032DA5EEC